MTEIWKDIKGGNGHYQVSNTGNIKSLKYGKKTKSIDIPDNLVKPLKIKAVKAGKSFKAYLEWIIKINAEK